MTKQKEDWLYGNHDTPQKDKKVINYPNRFAKYSTLPDVVKAIVKDRGNKYSYRLAISQAGVTTLSCILPSGVGISGFSFMNDDDKPVVNVGFKIAAGRLEGQLKYFDDVKDGLTNFHPNKVKSRI